MENPLHRQVVLLALVFFFLFSYKEKTGNHLKEAGPDWPVYLGGNSSAQYSPLDQVNGKQFIVIACGGGKMGTPSGDSYLAFTLGKK